MVVIISAMSKDRVIGSQNGMPWNVPEEYEQYLSLIKDQTVIMGRTSFEIFGADLTSAHTIVVSHSLTNIEGVEVCPSVETALEKAKSYGKTVFSAGGASIYSQTIPLADRMYLSTIKGEYQGDAYFPEFNKQVWQVEKHEDYPKFEWFVYTRK